MIKLKGVINIWQRDKELKKHENSEKKRTTKRVISSEWFR